MSRQVKHVDLPDEDDDDDEAKNDNDGGTERKDDPQRNSIVVNVRRAGRHSGRKRFWLRRAQNSADWLRVRWSHWWLNTPSHRKQHYFQTTAHLHCFLGEKIKYDFSNCTSKLKK